MGPGWVADWRMPVCIIAIHRGSAPGRSAAPVRIQITGIFADLRPKHHVATSQRRSADSSKQLIFKGSNYRNTLRGQKDVTVTLHAFALSHYLPDASVLTNDFDSDVRSEAIAVPGSTYDYVVISKPDSVKSSEVVFQLLTKIRDENPEIFDTDT